MDCGFTDLVRFCPSPLCCLCFSFWCHQALKMLPVLFSKQCKPILSPWSTTTTTTHTHTHAHTHLNIKSRRVSTFWHVLLYPQCRKHWPAQSKFLIKIWWMRWWNNSVNNWRGNHSVVLSCTRTYMTLSDISLPKQPCKEAWSYTCFSFAPSSE